MKALTRTHDVLVFDHLSLSPSEEIPQINAENFKLIRLSGLLFNQVEFSCFAQIQTEEMNLAQAMSDCGEWLGVFKNQDKDYVICADYYGYSSLFYAFITTDEQENKLVISSSFRGVASYLAKAGHQLSLNWPCVLPHLISNTNIFLTRASNHTFANEIQVLNYNEVLLLNNGKVYVVPRKYIQQRPNLQSYENLLQQGIASAVQSFSSWVQHTDLNVCFNLSGGKDSRVVLAMLLQSEFKDQLKMFTANPSNMTAGASKDILMKDFQIASKIVQHYGLSWFKRTGYREINLSYAEQLNIWQEFRSNSSFELKPKNKQIKDCKELRITGIGGELIRSYLGGAYKNNFPRWWEKVQHLGSAKESLQLLFKELCHPWLIDSELYTEAMEHFVASFIFDEDKAVLAQLDESYLAYRNRAHAGVAAVHKFEGALLKYPLCQIQFKQASHLLDPFEEENGRVLFDIIRLTEPKLNALEFAAPAWPKDFQISTEETWTTQQNSQAIAQYYELIKVKPSFVVENPEYYFDINESNAALFKLNSNLEIIANLSDRRAHFNQVIQRIARLSQKSTLMLHALVAKTESILDALFAKPVDCHVLSFDLQSNTHQSEEYYADENIELLATLKKIDLSQCDAELEFDAIARLASIRFQNIPEDCELAIYVYEDSQKMAVEWYKKMSHFDYGLIGKNVTHIRMMVFIKRIGEPEAQRIMNVEKTI